MNIDLYEMAYRNYKYSEIRKPDTNISISEKTKKSVMNTLEILKHTKEKIENAIQFSDVFCNVIPVFDEKTHNLSYRNDYMFIDGKKDDPNEIVKRFKKLDINTLPLIEVAKYLSIKVEKSNILKANGIFNSTENKITLGSDYPPIFIHELAHAIHHIFLESSGLSEYDEIFGGLDDFKDIQEYFYSFFELVAELSTVVLCRTYNISINVPHALCYLNNYSRLNINAKALFAKALFADVLRICEYVNKCVEKIEEKRRL